MLKWTGLRSYLEEDKGYTYIPGKVQSGYFVYGDGQQADLDTLDAAGYILVSGGIMEPKPMGAIGGLGILAAATAIGVLLVKVGGGKGGFLDRLAREVADRLVVDVLPLE